MDGYGWSAYRGRKGLCVFPTRATQASPPNSTSLPPLRAGFMRSCSGAHVGPQAHQIQRAPHVPLNLGTAGARKEENAEALIILQSTLYNLFFNMICYLC